VVPTLAAALDRVLVNEGTNRPNVLRLAEGGGAVLAEGAEGAVAHRRGGSATSTDILLEDIVL
jgi:hypothetical protein